MSVRYFLCAQEPLVERGEALPEDARLITPFVAEIFASPCSDLSGVDLVSLPGNVTPIKLFIADMDSTMIGQECIDELADYAGVKAEVAAVTEQAMQGALDFEAALQARVALLEGLPEKVLQQCYDERIHLNPGAEELLAGLRKADVRTVLVSGGFTFFASRIAMRLGFDDYLANRLEIQDGVLTGNILGDVIDGQKKADVLAANQVEMGLKAEEILAIGDGANDLLMIKAAGFGVAYRGKPILKEEAEILLDYARLDALSTIFDL